MNKFFAILLLIIALVALVYYIRTGPLTHFPLLNGSGSSTSLLPYDYSNRAHNSTSSTPTPRTQSSGVQNPTGQIDEKDIPVGFKRSQLSPFFHKIRVSLFKTNTGEEGGPGYEKITVTASGLSDKERVSIDGWLVKANAGGYSIAKGVSLYDPLSVPQPIPIVLRQNYSVDIFSTINPLAVNFRLNKCSGYLKYSYYVYPPPPQDCPAPSRSDYFTFSGQCQNYITSLQACHLAEANPKVPQGDYACRSYLKTLNYNGCFDRHHTESDFLRGGWWMFAGHWFLDPLHDRVLLFDANTLLVDEYVY